jgi:hypothetical protein
MMLFFKPRKILIPDVPPPTYSPRQSIVIAGIGVACATAVVIAVLFAVLAA